MGKKKVIEPIQETQNQEVKPERKKGTSNKPKEAKKPGAKVSTPIAKVADKAKVAAPASTPSIPQKVEVSKKVAAKTAPAKKTAKAAVESIKKKVKDLKKQWISAVEKVDELKKAFKKLKKKEGKAKAKESLGANLKTAKIERKSLKQAFKAAKKSNKKAA